MQGHSDKSECFVVRRLKLLARRGILREIISISLVAEGVAQVQSSRGKRQDEVVDARVGIAAAQ